jgi:hypothetical protein
VAIIDAIAAGQLLSGRKRIESRLSRSRRLPFGRIDVGDAVHFKLSGGSVIGTAHVKHVRHFDCLTPQRVHALQRQYNQAICAPPAYWRARRHCRYAVLIWVDQLASPPPALHVPRQFGGAWLELPGEPASLLPA